MISTALVVALLVLIAALPGTALGKSCPSGYTLGTIGGAQKCLHAGEYCIRSDAKQYRRYHFACDDINGTYRLEHS
jgi:hypothetical protein